MINELRVFCDSDPIWAMISLLLISAYLTLFIGFITAIIASHINHWRQARSTGDTHVAPTKEINMKGRIALVALLAIAFTLTGCGTFGNGQIDLPVEVSIEWHDVFGNGFALVDGSVTEATYRSLKTGVLYELADDGFRVTAPDGTTVKLKRKPEEQSAIGNQQSEILPPLAPPG